MFFSLDFILIFLPCILLGFYVIKKIFPSLCALYLVLLLYVTLYFIDLASFVMVLASSSINYVLVRKINQQKHQNLLVAFGVICALLPLLLFKFVPSLFREVAADSSILFTLGIPIGLSFYALQQITALIDCRKQAFAILPYHKHMLYLGFFPNFIAGPVFFYRDAVGPITELGYKPIPSDWIGNGLVLFFVGLCKKLWIADPIGGAIDHIITGAQSPAASMNIFEGWFVVWGFLVQLYFDFSAYSDMAIGLAMCFGIILPMNFDSPLKAFSAQEYIARWHMSFTGFVRIYFFIPMLGLLKKLPIKDTEKKMTFSWAAGLFLSYIIIGIWHAPDLVFMLSSTLVILILFLIKIPSLMLDSSKPALPIGYVRKYVNRTFLLLFSMLMVISLKTQDLSVLKMIYSSLIDFESIPLPDYAQSFIPSWAEGFVSFTGLSPLLSGYHSGEFVFVQTKAFFFLLFLATAIIFYLPNTMSVFGIKKTCENEFFQHGAGFRFYLILPILFFIVVFGLLFESNQMQNFIYELF
jgi:alginate O-acetyltransferase complex protein AlgI